MVRADASCDEVREFLSACHDGEEVGTEAQVAPHLAHCSPCSAFSRALPRLARQLSIRGAEHVGDLDAIASLLDGAGAPKVSARHRGLARRSRRGALGLVIPSLALAFAVPAAASGGLGHQIVTPTKAPTPCTHGLEPGAVGLVQPDATSHTSAHG